MRLSDIKKLSKKAKKNNPANSNGRVGTVYGGVGLHHHDDKDDSVDVEHIGSGDIGGDSGGGE